MQAPGATRYHTWPGASCSTVVNRCTRGGAMPEADPALAPRKCTAMHVVCMLV